MGRKNGFCFTFAVVSIFVVCGFGTLAANAAHPAYSLSFDSGRVVFEDRDGIIVLTRLETLLSDSQAAWIIGDATSPVPFWTVSVCDKDGHKHLVTTNDSPGEIVTSENNCLSFLWKDLEPGKLQVTASVSVKGSGLLWDFEVELGDEECALWDIVYPELGRIPLTGKNHGIMPYGWGVQHDDLLGVRHNRVYPSAAQAMPFLAVSDGNAGLYLGVHESAGYPVSFFIGKRGNESAACMKVRHDVEGMGIAKSYKLPYSVETVTFAGDWYEAGRIYREKAKVTPWGKIPPLAKRKDIPQWLLDTDLWVVGSCHDDETADKIIEFAKYFEVPTSAHVYTWHEIPFDDHYPEYFPAKPGFQDAVKKVQAAGIAVMPYINGRLWDPATDSWAAKNAQDACAIDENGEKYVEIYASKVALSPMCPFTELWQDTVFDLVNKLLNEVGVRAVYIDQISAASAKQCFSDQHGHPVGGGTYWIQGYRELLRKCLKIVPDDAALTTEENADPWNDQLHAWLMVNTQERGGELIPLYPVVYGGRAISFGFQYIHGGDLEKHFPFRLKMARAFVYGSQLGWVGTQILNEEHRTEAEFLKDLCLARHSARDALQFGEMLPPITFEGGGRVYWKEKAGPKDVQYDAPAVSASAWLTPNGQRQIAFVNVADDPRSITLKLNSRHLGEEATKLTEVTLSQIGGGAQISLENVQDGNWQAQIEIGALDGCVYTIVMQ